MTHDPIVNAVINLFEARSNEGMQRYGISMADNPKTALEWLTDAQEELMDAILYLEALRDSMPLAPAPAPAPATPQCYMCGGIVVHIADAQIFGRPHDQQSRLACFDCGAEYTVHHDERKLHG